MPTGDTETIIAWEYKGLLEKSVKPHLHQVIIFLQN